MGLLQGGGVEVGGNFNKSQHDVKISLERRVCGINTLLNTSLGQTHIYTACIEGLLNRGSSPDLRLK